jgi:hypothetical protein
MPRIPVASPPFNAAIPLGLSANSCAACYEYVLISDDRVFVNFFAIINHTFFQIAGHSIGDYLQCWSLYTVWWRHGMTLDGWQCCDSYVTERAVDRERMRRLRHSWQILHAHGRDTNVASEWAVNREFDIMVHKKIHGYVRRLILLRKDYHCHDWDSQHLGRLRNSPKHRVVRPDTSTIASHAERSYKLTLRKNSTVTLCRTAQHT